MTRRWQYSLLCRAVHMHGSRPVRAIPKARRAAADVRDCMHRHAPSSLCLMLCRPIQAPSVYVARPPHDILATYEPLLLNFGIDCECVRRSFTSTLSSWPAARDICPRPATGASSVRKHPHVRMRGHRRDKPPRLAPFHAMTVHGLHTVRGPRCAGVTENSISLTYRDNAGQEWEHLSLQPFPDRLE